MHKRRKRRRGYNPPLHIAYGIQEVLGDTQKFHIQYSAELNTAKVKRVHISINVIND